MQRARACLRSHHPEDVRRDVERGEREQPLGQPGRDRVALAAETRQVFLDPARAVTAAGGDPAPQDRLRIGGVGATFPSQQPVATPSLVLLECRRQFAGQRPGLGGVPTLEVAGDLRHGRLRHQVRIEQRRVQVPAQAGTVEFLYRRQALRCIGGQRAGDELAGGQELEIGGDAVCLRQCGLEPAAHRHLRDQDGVGLQQRLSGNGRAQFFRQQACKQVECVGVIEAEVGLRWHCRYLAAARSHTVRSCGQSRGPAWRYCGSGSARCSAPA